MPKVVVQSKSQMPVAPADMLSAPTKPIEVPPYLLQTLISTSDAVIRCAQALGSEIYVGLSNGELIRYALQADDPAKLESYMILSRQSVPNDKSVDEIVLLPSLQRALVHSDNQVHFYTLPSLDPVSIKPIRNIIALAVDQQHLQRPPPSNNTAVEPVHFCAIKRNAICMYSIRGDRLLFFKEIPLLNGATLAKRSGFTLCIANKTEYQMIDLENASALPLIPISQAFEPASFIVNPFIAIIDRSEFLILSYTGTNTMGLFITSNGDPVRGTLEWGQHPISLTFDYPYITALLPNGTIEVHSVENQTIAQVVSADEPYQRKKLVASLHGYLVPSTERSSKMRMVPVKLLRGQDPIPSQAKHTIVASFPAWDDVIDMVKGDRRVHDQLVAGYPRFFMHLGVVKLTSFCAENTQDELCMLFPSQTCADECVSFLRLQSIEARNAKYVVCDNPAIVLYLVLYRQSTAETQKVARKFWQYTGFGVSSRFGEYCLSIIADPTLATHTVADPIKDILLADPRIYEESQQGRNLALAYGSAAKHAIRQRIVDMLCKDSNYEKLSLGDVFLFPTGMAAIWHAHRITGAISPGRPSVCFGFPNADSLKVLEKWGSGTRFFPFGSASDIDLLEKEMEGEYRRHPGVSPFAVLFTEYPSNPLLRTVDLGRLRRLCDKYRLPIIVDETVGGFANIDILKDVDILVTSMSKAFSGVGDVLGGSLVLNPYRNHYSQLKTRLEESFEDLYFAQDAAVMERNSRTFASRVKMCDNNARIVCEYLHSRSVAGGSAGSVLLDVLYPRYTTPGLYTRYLRQGGGLGSLFSVVFSSIEACKTFYDALKLHKGNSFGTHFTLCCAIVPVSFGMDEEWAAECGLSLSQLRISVGTEDAEFLVDAMKDALDV